MIALGVLLIIGPDFLYLRDNFGYRINTVLSFTIIWIVLSPPAYGIIILLRNLRSAANIVFSVIFALVLVVGLTYPAIGIFSKTNNFRPPFGYTSMTSTVSSEPDEAAAIRGYARAGWGRC
jgi:hypothetical protein